MTSNEKVQKDKDKSDPKGEKPQTKSAANSQQILNSNGAVPMLRFGVSNKFDLFRRKVSVACMERYKNLGK